MQKLNDSQKYQCNRNNNDSSVKFEKSINLKIKQILKSKGSGFICVV